MYMSACQGGDWQLALGDWRFSSGRRIRTEREDEPESIHTSRVSLDLDAASGPAQPQGLTAAQSSPTDFSNQTLEPCFSIKSAALRTIFTSRIGVPLTS